MFFVFFQFDLFGKIVQAAIDPHPHKTAFARVLQDLDVFAFARPDHRGQDLHFGAHVIAHQLVDDLVDGLLLDLFAAFGAMGNADARPQQAEVIVDLRHGAHSGAGVFGGGLLVDGDGRGKPFDIVHIRLFHLPQKLPGIGGKRLYIAALPFGIDGIKGQGALARTGDARDHSQGIPGDGHIHVFQVVLPGSLDKYFIVHGYPLSFLRLRPEPAVSLPSRSFLI